MASWSRNSQVPAALIAAAAAARAPEEPIGIGLGYVPTPGRVPAGGASGPERERLGPLGPAARRPGRSRLRGVVDDAKQGQSACVLERGLACLVRFDEKPHCGEDGTAVENRLVGRVQLLPVAG